MTIEINNLETFLNSTDQNDDEQLISFEEENGIECQECSTIHTDEAIFFSLVCTNCEMIIDV